MKLVYSSVGAMTNLSRLSFETTVCTVRLVLDDQAVQQYHKAAKAC